MENFRHPSLRAKKYDEARNIWQARVNRDWRFYFVITGDTYLILNISPTQNNAHALIRTTSEVART